MSGLTPQLLLGAYASGIFPMAENRYDPDLYWIDPDRRGILPLDRFHIPRRLRKTLRTQYYDVRCNTDFISVVSECAAPSSYRPETWINNEIEALYGALHDMGFAHSIECWQTTENGSRLVGGLYGVALGGAFFGESMFSRARDASKVALCHLVARLMAGGFTLLDTQFVTDHLTQFGVVEIDRADYKQRLADALKHEARIQPELDAGALEEFIQSTTQTS